MDREKDTGAPAGGGLKRFLPSMKGALGRSRRPLVAIVLIVLVFGLGYALFVRERLRQVQERHVRLLGNAADKLERVVELTRENGDNLIRDLAALPTFLRQNPYVDLLDREDPAVLARSLSAAPGEARTELVSEVPRLELQIHGLVEQAREARIRDKKLAGEILGRLEATDTTRLEKPQSQAAAPASHVDLLDVVERLELDLPVYPGELALEPGNLEAGAIDAGEPPMLLVKTPAGESAREIEVVGQFFMLSAAAQSGQIRLAETLSVQFEEPAAGQPRAIFAEGNLRLEGLPQLLRTELELTEEQQRRLSTVRPVDVQIQVDEDAECGKWVFQDGRPLDRISDRLKDAGGWSRATARRDGRYLKEGSGDRESVTRLGWFQHGRIPEEGLEVGSYCRPNLGAGGTSVSLSPEQQRRIELLLRKLAQASSVRPSYADDLRALRVNQPPAGDRAAGRFELTAEFEAGPIVLKLPEKARELLPESSKATLSQLKVGPPTGSPTFLLGITLERLGEPTETLMRVPIGADGYQRTLLKRIAAEKEAAIFNLTQVAEDRSYRLSASVRKAHPRIPLVLVDGMSFDLPRAARFEGTLGTRTDAGWGLRLGGGEKRSDEDPLTFSLDLESVLASGRLDAAFTSYFLADNQGQILFQRRPEAVARVHGSRRVRQRSGVRFRVLEPPESGAAGTPGSRGDSSKEDDAKSDRPAETGPRLTCQPARLQLEGSTEVWWVCGQVDRRAAVSEALGSTPYVTFGLLAVVLLGGLSIPFLRFTLMARNERLRRGDILMLLAGTWIALSIVAVVPAALHRHEVLESVLEGQMIRLADRVGEKLATNLGNSRALLGELDAMASEAFECAWLQAPPQQVPQQVRLLEDHQSPRLGLRRSKLRQDPVSPFTSVFWTDAEGRQIAKATVGPENTPAVSLGHRSYFKAVAEDRPWTVRLARDGEGQWLFFDTFLSITTGERSAALSMPSGLPLGDCGAPGKAAAVLTGLPPAIRAPVISGPLGFAVIDASGTTLFHSQPGLALTSNFLEDIGKPDELAAALVSRTSRQFDAPYQSRPHSLYVRPLFADGSLPGGRPGWWIVTFFDKELPRTVVSEAVLQSLVPTLSTGLFLGLLLFFFRKRVLRDLWPTMGESDHYLFLGAVYLLVVLVQLAALFSPSVTASPILLAGLYTLLPMTVLLGSSLLLHRERATGSPEASAGERTGDPAKAARPAGFMARAGAGIRRLTDRLAGWLQPGSDWTRRTWERIFSKRVSLAYVAGMILLWVLLAVLPTLGFFNNAWTRELSVLLEHDALMTLEALAERREETRRYLARSDLDDPRILERRLAGRDDLYLFSAAAELLVRQQERDFLEGWLSDPTVGARAISPPVGWTDRVLSDFLPIYNRASQSLRYLGAGKVRGLWFSGETQQLTLPGSSRQLAGDVDDYVSMIDSATEPNDLWQLVLPVLLLLALLVALALWVWYTVNHICFSRVRIERGEELDRLIRTIREQASLTWTEPATPGAAAAGDASAPVAPRPVRGFIIVVTSREHYEALQALGEARDLCEFDAPGPRPSAARRWGLQRRARADSAAASDGQRAIVICRRLETGIEDPESRKRKLANLRELIKSPLELPVLLCPRDPREILRPAMPGGTTEAAAGPKSFELDEEEAAIWSGVLRRLELHHLALPLQGRRGDEPRREEDYWVIWSNCSEHERLAMMQLAAEGLLNPKQADAVASLGKRGIVHFAPTLQFTDPELRAFVARFKESPHFRRVESEARSAGWGGRRWLLSTVVVVAAVFLFLTKPELFSATLAILTATAAAIPAFLNLLGASGGARRADG